NECRFLCCRDDSSEGCRDKCLTSKVKNRLSGEFGMVDSTTRKKRDVKVFQQFPRFLTLLPGKWILTM
ncbi:MAG: hypothetical protein J6038_03140, partial [Bacilli bacterium]|nr:hypothetical protein [Bacilli bacterium]